MKNKLISMVEKYPTDPYSIFLTQPLQLGFFTPCDLEGNLLEYPDQQATERVLFEGFEVFGNYIKHLINLIDNEILKTIQDLMPYNLTLTEKTAKKLGLNQELKLK